MMTTTNLQCLLRKWMIKALGKFKDVATAVYDLFSVC